MLLRNEVGLLGGSTDAIRTRQVYFVFVFRLKTRERLEHLNLLLDKESSDSMKYTDKAYTDS